MTVKELKNILSEIPENIEIKMISLREDNVNDNFNIADIVFVKPYVGEQYKEELVLIPE